jgi:hypothetical protein
LKITFYVQLRLLRAYSQVPYAVLFPRAELAPANEKQAQPVGISCVEGNICGGASKTAERRCVSVAVVACCNR